MLVFPFHGHCQNRPATGLEKEMNLQLFENIMFDTSAIPFFRKWK
jgi:hypothetical protein